MEGVSDAWFGPGCFAHRGVVEKPPSMRRRTSVMLAVVVVRAVIIALGGIRE
jgi:hypothetical protein